MLGAGNGEVEGSMLVVRAPLLFVVQRGLLSMSGLSTRKSYSTGVAIRFITVFATSIFIAACLGVFYQLTQVRVEQEILERQSLAEVEFRVESINAYLMAVESDLNALSTHHDLRFALDDNAPSDIWQRFAKDLSDFAKAKRTYDQVRFIDHTGMERVRINYDSGLCRIVPQSELQLKVSRYYFTEAMSLSAQEVYVSPFDLNIEHGEIEQPVKPVIRFAKVVLGSDGRRRGVLILNYFGRVLLDSFANNNLNYKGGIMLLNDEGYWLKGVSAEDEWGFMFEERGSRRFENRYPQAWRELQNRDSGQFYTEEGLFTFRKVHPLHNFQTADKMVNHSVSFSRDWIVVSLVQANAATLIAEMLGQRGIRFLIVITIIFLASLSWKIAHSSARRHMAEEERNILSATLEQSPVAVLVANVCGRVVYVNRCFATITGFTGDDVLGWAMQDLLGQSLQDDFYSELWTQAQKGRQWCGEGKSRKKDGSIYWAAISISPISNSHGDVTHFVTIMEDITARKAAEDALKSRTVELERFNTVLVDREERLIQLKEEVNGFCQKIGESERYPPVWRG